MNCTVEIKAITNLSIGQYYRRRNPSRAPGALNRDASSVLFYGPRFRLIPSITRKRRARRPEEILSSRLSTARTQPALLFAFVAASLPAGALAADAGAFPGKPVRWVVPFPPSGSIDLVGRVVAQKL